jgi:cold shock CspA family protein/Tfp pilus assembly protein PilF
MAYTIQRLTMYSLISALERDLRDFLSLHVAPLVPANKLLPDLMASKATERFLKENPSQSPTVEDLIEYLDLGDEIQTIRMHDNRLDDLTSKYIKRYYVSLESLIPVRNRVMHARPLEFDDLPKVTDLASELVKSHGLLWANLRTTRRDLDRNPEFVTTLTIPDMPDEDKKILHNLPQVEFDDTGFVGRGKELNELNRALLGSYPIVTIVGEGGLGKTALALKACYDLLDNNEPRLDAIVWTTAKATKLTLSEIQTIEGAISSSLGIIESAAAMLGRQTETSAMDDLLLHLENNRILLVIDNLETVIDQNIRRLVRNIPKGSRILFTTRIGLGAFDFPISLLPLNKKEASVYFRRAAGVYRVNDLAGATQQVVDGYCDKLNNNPLFIKWFMQCLRAGKRPTVLTNDPTLFLQFCLQNVFNALSSESKIVAGTLAGVNGAQSVASLAFFTDLDSISIQSALSHLITSNLVSTERGRSSDDEDRYLLSPIARMYVQKFVRPNTDEQKRLIQKQNILRSAQEEYAARVGSDIFDINYIFVRDKDDYIVAKILSQAVEYIFKKETNLATAAVQNAMNLSPNYFEVHRVNALLYTSLDDFFAANSAYERAISLAPDRAPLRLLFAGFLSRYLGDHEQALEQLLKAEELAPKSAVVALECARILQYNRRYDDAEKRLRNIQDLNKLPARARRVQLDLLLQNDLRKAENYATQQQFQFALECFEKAKRIFENAPKALIDARTIRNISRKMRYFVPLRKSFEGLPEEGRVELIEKWLSDLSYGTSTEEGGKNEIEQLSTSADAANSVPGRGRLCRLHATFGFVEAGGTSLFFHKGSWLGRGDFSTLAEGRIVEFDIGRNEKGPCAINVRPVDEERVIIEEGKILRGAIKHITATYGFIKLDVGGDLFFHKDYCAEDTVFRKLAVGQRVRCTFGKGKGQRPCGLNVEAYSGL